MAAMTRRSGTWNRKRELNCTFPGAYAVGEGRRITIQLGASEPDRPKLVTFESVYSMDGDIAPMPNYAPLPKRMER